MSEKLTSAVEKTVDAIECSAARPARLIDTPDKPCFVNVAASTNTPTSPPSVPNNDTESLILESGALICASTGTVPNPGKQGTPNHDQNVAIPFSNSTMSPLSKCVFQI